MGCFISFYVEVFLKTSFGQLQIERYEGGVSGQTEFTQDSIAEIKIPIIPNEVQKNIESEYLKMVIFHNKAIEAKIKKDNTLFNQNIKIAKEMLKNLITKTEEVIEGKIEDVN